jgi:hypothetical protein
LDNDQQLAEEGARNLGATIFKHYKNLDFENFHKLIGELNKLLKKNAAEGKKTVLYI